MKKYVLFCFAFAGLLLSSCITEEGADNTPTGNFETCWKLIDEHYCFFDYKKEQYGLDWAAVRQHYRQGVTNGMSHEQLFEVLRRMTAELRDGHVNLTAAHDVARYGAWFDDYPMNFSDSLERIYLGRSEDFRLGSGLRYRVLPDNIGYIRCRTFASAFGSGNLQEMMRALATCDGLIVDVRNNGGGLLTSAENLASLFVNERTLVGFMQHKRGPAHNDFSPLERVSIKPFRGLRWQKPVCVLTNRRTFSAANSFVMMLKGLPNVTIVGDRTGGGAGLPFSSELPNGWMLRFSASPMYNREKQLTEMGIDPDVKAAITSADYARGRDTIIEKARRLLHTLPHP